MNTRPCASVMKLPACPYGGCGAAEAVAARTRLSSAAASPARIAGRLPHLAARDVHLGGSLAGHGAGPCAPGGATRLPLDLHDARRRTRLVDGAGGLRERDGVDPARDGRAADL